MQQWYWDEDYKQLWSVPERDIMKTKEFMDNLCRQLNTEGDLVAKTKREVKKLCPSSLSLEEFKTRLSAHHMRVLEDVDSQLSDGGDRGISVEMSLHDKTAEQLMGLLAMESVAYGGRANDTHRLIWVGDDEANVFQLMRDGCIQENDSMLLRTIGASPKYTVMIPQAKGHFEHKKLHAQSRLIDLVLKCYPEITIGDLIFRPDCWGRRGTKVPRGEDHAMRNRFFMTSLRFAEYIRIVRDCVARSSW